MLLIEVKTLLLLVILVLALDFLFDETSLLRWQIVETTNFLLRVIVDVVLDEVGGGHGVDLERLVAVEGEKAKRQQVQQLSATV